MNDEVWKPVVDYEEYYEVSNFGNVRSKDREVFNGSGYYLKRGRELSKTLTSTGYYKVELYKCGEKKSKKVHRLVAEAFIGVPDSNRDIINHIDNNPLNNVVDNLEWCNQSENMIHAYKTQSRETNFHKYKDKILNEYVADENVTINGLSRKYDCSVTTIRKYLKKNRIRIRPSSEAMKKYKIDRNKLINDFNSGLSNKVIAAKYKTNTTLIATYRYKFKKGELIVC